MINQQGQDPRNHIQQTQTNGQNVSTQPNFQQNFFQQQLQQLQQLQTQQLQQQQNQQNLTNTQTNEQNGSTQPILQQDLLQKQYQQIQQLQQQIFQMQQQFYQQQMMFLQSQPQNQSNQTKQLQAMARTMNQFPTTNLQGQQQQFSNNIPLQVPQNTIPNQTNLQNNSNQQNNNLLNQPQTKNMETLKTNSNTQNKINQTCQTSKLDLDQKTVNLNEQPTTLMKTNESENKNQPVLKDQPFVDQKELNKKGFAEKKKEIVINKDHQSQNRNFVKNNDRNQTGETTNLTKNFQINEKEDNKIIENSQPNKLENENENENDENKKEEQNQSNKLKDEEAKENINELQDENKLENKNKQSLQDIEFEDDEEENENNEKKKEKHENELEENHEKDEEEKEKQNNENYKKSYINENDKVFKINLDDEQEIQKKEFKKNTSENENKKENQEKEKEKEKEKEQEKEIKDVTKDEEEEKNSNKILKTNLDYDEKEIQKKEIKKNTSDNENKNENDHTSKNTKKKEENEIKDVMEEEEENVKNKLGNENWRKTKNEENKEKYKKNENENENENENKESNQNKETSNNTSYKNEKNQEKENQEIKYFPQQAIDGDDDNSKSNHTPKDKKSLFSYFFSANESVPEYVNNQTTIDNSLKKKRTSKKKSNKHQKQLKSGFANRFLFDINEQENNKKQILHEDKDVNHNNNNNNNNNSSDESEISEEGKSQNESPLISRSSKLLNHNISTQKEKNDKQKSFSTYSSESIPKYIFDSLKGNTSKILKEDQVSCFLVTPYYFIVGTEKGFIIKIDFDGNIISRQLIHQLNVNIISVSKNGKYICTCSNDGMICIIGVKSKHKKIYSYHQPIRSVAINPKYPQKKKVFAVGLKNGDIIIASSGMMRSKVHIISQDEGQIYSIDWKGSFIVWASTRGISVYSIKQKMLIGNYKESILFPQSSLYHSIFHWISERRFIVAWSTFFKVFEINAKKKNTSIKCIKNINFDSVISGVCKYKKFFIVLSGEDEEKKIMIKRTEVKISNLKNQSKNLKGSLKDNNSNEDQNIIKEYVTVKKRELIKKYPPKITFISHENFQIISKELIEIDDYEKYCYFDYRIENSNEQFFLVSPMKIYIGRLRRIDEVVDWLLEKNRFHEALKIGRNNISKLKSHQINDIGFQLLMYYIKNDYWGQAAIECKDICKNSHNIWIDIIEIFLQYHKFKYLYKYIPIKSPQFSKKFYEKLLINCINDRLWDELIYCIQFWPTTHYSYELLIPTLKKVLENDFLYMNPFFIKNLFYYDTKFIESSQNNKDVDISSKNGDNEDGNNNKDNNDNKKEKEREKETNDEEREKEFLKIINCLFQLYYYSENYYPVLIISVYYKFINPYNLITQYKLFSNLGLLVMPLIKYDQKKTIEFFVKHSDQIPIEMVIKEFEKKKELNQYYLYEYLDALFEKSPKIGEKYHFLLFKLYSEYNRLKIFAILNLSESIPLDKAVLICKKKKFFEETAKIYDMMGNYIDCLKIKLKNCENMESIIKYVESKKDKDLWHQLIEHCLVRPKYLAVLLEKFPRTGIDFLEIVNKIPKNTKIDRLKENICNIILDRQIFVELMKVTKLSIKNDSSYLLNLLSEKKQCGVFIDHTLTCSICQLPIKKLDMQYRIFNCGHHFHENCLTQYLINSHEMKIENQLLENSQKKDNISVKDLKLANKSITPSIQQISFFCVICQKSEKDSIW
ncbi:vacuolar protein sorting-associated protein 41 [Anaeramoeba flamelloides]|uniref:Vacuolar protein sorting-associated protein 41 n=1 Tax=Anaeramoeba flamelloides TaxID=1746091 RepID=A0AAV7YKL7_9EUKA|nr:vacuolar protein sorting-associated protein 41 [Anaeramoeba flamelloides]